MRESLIAKFNEQHSLKEILEDAGYIRKGHRWISPNSHTMTPGIVMLDGRVFSHHDGDALHNGHKLDAFGAYAAIHHQGDLKAAARAVRAEACHD